jgi:hypothetical protein
MFTLTIWKRHGRALRVIELRHQKKGGGHFLPATLTTIQHGQGRERTGTGEA